MNYYDPWDDNDYGDDAWGRPIVRQVKPSLQDISKIVSAAIRAMQELDRRIANGMAIKDLYSELANIVAFHSKDIDHNASQAIMNALYERVNGWMKSGK